MPSIRIINSSNHEQEFKVNGLTSDKKVIKVKPGGTVAISSPDHQERSGAIIALHEGHEGEQAEITFNAGNNIQYYDISVIVGAGGNLTIEQAGKPSTRKGDPLFMQKLRTAYSHADRSTKEALKRSIHFNSHGQISRIGALKEHPALEKFVRTFAEEKQYVGVGAWQDSPGHPRDNKQSSGTLNGNADLELRYSD